MKLFNNIGELLFDHLTEGQAWAVILIASLCIGCLFAFAVEQIEKWVFVLRVLWPFIRQQWRSVKKARKAALLSCQKWYLLHKDDIVHDYQEHVQWWSN